METRWLYNTSENLEKLREASCETCVIPIGSVEKHGLHMPLGTDILMAENIAYQASQLETVTVFPGFTFGDMPCASPKQPAGTVTVPMELEMEMLEILCRQIARSGYKKILIFNCHGGNQMWLATFLRKLENHPHDDFVAARMYVKCDIEKRIMDIYEKEGLAALPELTEEDIAICRGYVENHFTDGHAGVSETAYIMGIAPEAVKMDRLGVISGLSQNRTAKFREAGIDLRDGGWDFDYPNYYEGHDPVGMNERIGKAAMRIEAERVAKGFKVFKEDTELFPMHLSLWK